MPKLAMPVRVLVTGEPQTPAIDATLELIGQDKVVARLQAGLQAAQA
jgi:glutamyl-tRNA synthetase